MGTISGSGPVMRDLIQTINKKHKNIFLRAKKNSFKETRLCGSLQALFIMCHWVNILHRP